MSSTNDPPDTRVRVWDLPVRLFHWALAVLVTAAFITGEEDDWASAHARVGVLVLGLVVFRVAWGFIGSPPARFSAFVRSPAEVLRYARAYVAGRPPLHLSHNPLGAAMVVTLLATLMATVVTGIALRLGPEWDGPLTPYFTRGAAKALEEAHEVAAGALPILAVLHVAGVLVSSVLERQNLVGAMITGLKRADGAPPPPLRWPVLRLGAAALAGVGAAWLGLQLVAARPADAAITPAVLAEAYAADARREEPDFRGASAARGEELFRRKIARDGKTAGCTDCHTADPTAVGRTPAGKRIEPLAPSANPEAFTDRARADKWFDRNCKQVLGRPCAAREKGDLLAWLMTR